MRSCSSPNAVTERLQESGKSCIDHDVRWRLLFGGHVANTRGPRTVALVYRRGGESKTVLRTTEGVDCRAMQMPNLYTHLDPGHLSQFADRTLIRADETVTETVTEKLKRKSKRVCACFNGKGGTRTLDPGIMSAVPAPPFKKRQLCYDSGPY
jgi:hypothetical protein